MLEGKLDTRRRAALVDAPSFCFPLATSHFVVEHLAVADGIRAEIRSLAWDRSFDGTFRADRHYIDYLLMPPAARSRLFYTDGRRSPSPGESVFIPRGAVVEVHTDPGEQRLMCLALEHERAIKLFERAERVTELAPCLDVRSELVHHALVRLTDELQNPGFANDILLESLALVLVAELCRHMEQERPEEALAPGRIAAWRLKRLHERIEHGLTGRLSIVDLASDCGLSPRHLNRTFKNTTGMTLGDYITKARLERAKAQLGWHDVPIKVVAFNCGFKTPAAFSAAFRKAAGITPRAFRNQHLRLLPDQARD